MTINDPREVSHLRPCRRELPSPPASPSRSSPTEPPSAPRRPLERPAHGSPPTPPGRHRRDASPPSAVTSSTPPQGRPPPPRLPRAGPRSGAASRRPASPRSVAASSTWTAPSPHPKASTMRRTRGPRHLLRPPPILPTLDKLVKESTSALDPQPRPTYKSSPRLQGSEGREKFRWRIGLARRDTPPWPACSRRVDPQVQARLYDVHLTDSSTPHSRPQVELRPRPLDVPDAACPARNQLPHHVARQKGREYPGRAAAVGGVCEGRRPMMVSRERREQEQGNSGTCEPGSHDAKPFFSPALCSAAHALSIDSPSYCIYIPTKARHALTQLYRLLPSLSPTSTSSHASLLEARPREQRRSPPSFRRTRSRRLLDRLRTPRRIDFLSNLRFEDYDLLYLASLRATTALRFAPPSSTTSAHTLTCDSTPPLGTAFSRTSRSCA